MTKQFMGSYACGVAETIFGYSARNLAQHQHFLKNMENPPDSFEVLGDATFGSVEGLVQKVNEVLSGLDKKVSGAEVRAVFNNDPHYRVQDPDYITKNYFKDLLNIPDKKVKTVFINDKLIPLK